MKYRCEMCDGEFSTSGNLVRHSRRIHNIVSEISANNKVIKQKPTLFRCLENEGSCENSSYKRNQMLIEHLKDVHDMEFELVVLSVSSMEEFEKWRGQIESENIAKYILQTRVGNSTYYYCNRNAKKYRRSEPYKRRPKKQGSCKMDSHCTSYIKLEHRTEEVKVFWQKTHYGHMPELQHIRLTKEEKLFVAENLMKGVQPEIILKSIGNSAGESRRRIDLLKRADVRNIQRSTIKKLKTEGKWKIRSKSPPLPVNEMYVKTDEGSDILAQDSNTLGSGVREQNLQPKISPTVLSSFFDGTYPEPIQDVLEPGEVLDFSQIQTGRSKTEPFDRKKAEDQIRSSLEKLKKVDFSKFDVETVKKILYHISCIEVLVQNAEIPRNFLRPVIHDHDYSKR